MTHDEMIEVIKAHKEGKIIQVLANGSWVDSNPSWNFFALKYRIKPDPKPDVADYFSVTPSMWYRHESCSCNLKLTFDGETGKLKAAEVLK